MPELGVYLVKSASQRGDRGRFDVIGRVEVRFAGAEAADIDAFRLSSPWLWLSMRESERRSELSGAA